MKTAEWDFRQTQIKNAQTVGLRRGHCSFESFPDETRVGNAARLCPSLKSGKQWPGHTHVDLFVFFLKFKPRRFELRKIKVRQVLRKERFSFLICFESWHFLFHSLRSPSRAYTGPSSGG